MFNLKNQGLLKEFLSKIIWISTKSLKGYFVIKKFSLLHLILPVLKRDGFIKGFSKGHKVENFSSSNQRNSVVYVSNNSKPTFMNFYIPRTFNNISVSTIRSDRFLFNKYALFLVLPPVDQKGCLDRKLTSRVVNKDQFLLRYKYGIFLCALW